MAKKSSRWLIIATWALALLGVVAAPGTAAADDQVEPPAINYCDYDNGHPGVSSVKTWLEGAPPEANTDCIDVGDIIKSCGVVQIPITDRVIGESTTPPMDYWIEYTEVGTGVTGAQVMPKEGVSFPEGYNGGSVTIQAYIGGPEQDYVDFANEDEWKYPGQQITIDTNCEQPAQINYCDYEGNKPIGGSVANWLAGAPEGANTDCIDVSEPVLTCGAFDLPIENKVLGMSYQIEYIEDGVTKILPEGGVTWDEDYNDGSVTITVYVGGPEQDYVDFANVGDWQYPGTEVTIQTDCESPAPPVTDPPVTDPPPAKDVTPKATSLPKTGSNLQTAAAAGSVVLLVMGAAALVIGRYRRGDAS